MLMRFDPFRELERLTQSTVGRAATPLMAMDAYREGDHFVVHFDLPGVDPESIELTVEKNVLTARAVRSWPDQEGRDWVVAERPQGTVSRQVFLGDTLDADHVEASYDRGVLTLTIPVAEQARPRRVEVTTGGGKAQAIDAQSSAA